ncbi:unnamed protein product [Fusarium venenatum]|uniref:Uncharacterized protein n=1 Tax=Fusarium venenatum TaxID=56646 RepID=A0A2L2TFQ2_9HYPO|nr:uncharacterized protein FVRRES_09889 [Fusarium venenatum]CEI69812.1 unnamed protein product [Fusarium venenatum]
MRSTAALRMFRQTPRMLRPVPVSYYRRRTRLATPSLSDSESSSRSLLSCTPSLSLSASLSALPATPFLASSLSTRTSVSLDRALLRVRQAAVTVRARSTKLIPKNRVTLGE